MANPLPFYLNNQIQAPSILVDFAGVRLTGTRHSGRRGIPDQLEVHSRLQVGIITKIERRPQEPNVSDWSNRDIELCVPSLNVFSTPDVADFLPGSGIISGMEDPELRGAWESWAPLRAASDHRMPRI